MNNEYAVGNLATPNFSLAFKQMASFVAIAKTRLSSEVLDELIQQCFVLLPTEPLSSSKQINTAINALFGIPLAEKDVEIAIQRLLRAGNLSKLSADHLVLNSEVQISLLARIGEATKLEQDVQADWIQQVRKESPKLDSQKLWLALRAYLAQAFRRHGIQAIELLNTSVRVANENGGSLSTVLDSVIYSEFQGEDKITTRNAISIFFQSIGANRKRAQYITNLADGAFNYFSLAVAPEVSENLRVDLNELTLFLDTNFLFGILNLHTNSQVDVSSELLNAIRQFKLPFRLRYHDATIREMTNTLSFFGGELKKRKWPQKISRAIVSTESLSGIELRYHSKNAQYSVEVGDFLAPYEHWQLLLKDKKIDVYNVPSTENRLNARADLEADYKEYLATVNKKKSHDAIQHDMAVLETIRSLRTNAKSTLEAGSILVTCDSYLFRFDIEQSRKNQHYPCTVLPSLLWQILRPFTVDNEEFDKAFAETFALPEFSLGRGEAERAARRMASILASYNDIPEETATKMLANDLLIAALQTKRTDVEFEQTIESALAAENTYLVEEKMHLAKQLEAEKQEHEAKQRELDAEKAQHEAKQRELDSKSEILRSREEELAKKEQMLNTKDVTIKRLEAQSEDVSHKAREAAQQVVKEQQEKLSAERQVEELKQAKVIAERNTLRTAKIASVLTGLLAVGLFELVIHIVLPWRWLLEHPNGYGLQCCLSVSIFSLILGLWVKPWRKTIWVVVIAGAVFTAFEILGGRKPPSP